MKPPLPNVTAFDAHRIVRALRRLRLQVDIQLWRQGWLWPAGLVLLVLAAVAWQWGLRPQQQALMQAQQETLRLHARRLASEPPTAVPPAATPDNQSEVALERLHAVLGSHSGLGQQLRLLYVIAAKENLALVRSEYQRTPILAGGIERMQVTLPFRASYPQLRRFVEALLIEMPNVSIDQLSFKRVQVSQAQVDVRLRLSFWVKASDTAVPAMPPRKPVEGRNP